MSTTLDTNATGHPNPSFNQTSQNSNSQSSTNNTNNQPIENIDNNNENFGGGGDGGGSGGGDDDDDRDNNEENNSNLDIKQANQLKLKRKCFMCKRTRNRNTRKLPLNKSDLLTDNIQNILKKEFNLLFTQSTHPNQHDKSDTSDFNLRKERFCNSCFAKINKKIDELLNYEDASIMSPDEVPLVIDDDNNQNIEKVSPVHGFPR